MNKKSVLWILLDLIFLAVFNTVFFLICETSHPASVWISYGFIHFAYLLVLVTPYLIRNGSRSTVFGYSLLSISTAYFFVEFVVGLVFIFIHSGSYEASLIAQIILAGIYGALLLSNMIANEHTADSVKRHEDEVAYIKTASARLKALVGKASDQKANKEIDRAFDAMHASPSKTVSNVFSIESEIMKKTAELEDAVSAQNTPAIISIAGEIVNLIEERNRKIRLSN